MNPLTPNVASNREVPSHGTNPRSVYSAPSLTCYGLVQDLTQAGSKNANESASATCKTETTKKSNSNCV